MTAPGTIHDETGAAPLAGPYQLRLYVAGGLPNSVQAQENLQAICEEYLEGRCSVELIDFLQQPQRALEDGVVATPTLVKLGPGPRQMVVGTLSDRPTVLRALGLVERP